MTLSFAPDAIETWPLSRLQPYARNAKAHGADQVAKIAASMAEFGWTVPCLVAEDGELIAGHGRVLAATQLGLTEAPVIVLGHLTEAQRRAYRIADNKLTELGTWDEALLSAELNDLLAEDFDLSLVGFSDGELDKLLAFVPEGDGEEGGTGGSVPPVTIPEPPRNPASRTGDLWILGDHRLLCGDSTSAADVRRLMNGERAILFATDPPYLVDYDGSNHPTRNKDWSASYGTTWDDSSQGAELYDGFIAAAVAEAIAEDAAWYCWHASRRQAMLEACWEKAGAFVHQQIIWVKDRGVLTRSHYLWKHEPCFMGWRRPNRPPKVAEQTLPSTWEMPSFAKDERPDHPTPKPLDAFGIPMRQHVARGGLCYEPFSGSGSQIMAGEANGRRVFAMEISPAYIDVAVERWQADTGRDAILDGDGRTFAVVKAERLAETPPEPETLTLAEARSLTFAHRRKVFLVSTPTIRGLSRIEREYEASDQRRFFVPCPHCGAMQWLKFDRLRWQKGRPETAEYHCEGCDAAIAEHHKTAMLEGGEWRATATAADPTTVGYHLSALYSPIGWLSWERIVRSWEAAQGSDEAIKAFRNTILGETWVESGEAPDWQRLYDRREAWKPGAVPAGGLFLTAGADVQKDRIEVDVWAWGRGLESWLVDHVVIEGGPDRHDAWSELTALLDRSWPHERGAHLRIARLAIDTGYEAPAVYSWSRAHGFAQVSPVKGVEGFNRSSPVSGPTFVDATEGGKRLRRGARLPAMYGNSIAQLESDVVWGIITANPAMADGTALFHANHKNLAGTGAALAVDAVGAARAAMALQTGLDKKTVLNIRPAFLIVPAALELKAEQLVAQNLVPADSAKVVPQSIRTLSPISEPRLDAAGATSWYLAASPNQIDTIEYAYLEGQQGAYIETRNGFDVDGVEIKCRLDFGAKAIDWRGLYKNPGA